MMGRVFSFRHFSSCTSALYFAYLMLVPHASHGADWSLNPSVTVSEQYDSNIRLLPNNAPNKQSDFITSFTPELSLSRDTELTKLKFDSITSARKYVENPGLDSIDTASRVSLTTRWSPGFSTDISTAFVHDTTMEDQLDQSGIRTIRAERYRCEFGAGAKYAFTERFSLLVSGGGGQSLYPSGEAPDQLTTQFAVTPAWAATERDTIGLGMAFTYKDYEDGLKIHTFSQVIYWQGILSETFNFKLGAGYEIQFSDFAPTPDRPVQPGGLEPARGSETATESMPIALMEFKKDWSERLSTTMNAGRQQYTDVDGRSFESNFAGGSARYLLSELVSFNLTARYYANRQIEQGDQEIDYLALSPSVERKLTENLGVSLRGSYELELSRKRSVDSRADRCRTWVELTYRWPRFLASY